MRSLTFASLLLVLAASCGDDDSGGDVTCNDVCASIASACGSTPPGCVESCAVLSQSVRRCAVAASTCAQIDACSMDADAGSMDAGSMDVGSMDTGPDLDAGAECTIGEVESCPGPSATCTNAIINGTSWCSPVCDDGSECGEFVCNGSGGYCVPGCTMANPSCPAPFTECEVGLGGTGYCR